MAEYDEYIKFHNEKYDLPAFRGSEREEKNLVFITLRSSKAREEIQKLNPLPSWKTFWHLCSENTFPIE